ncbi:MAG: acylphosphatase [Alphaproteobacteria bacterium]|nr:acylphosphatase [Alphaproteobacteria bacterium]
MTDRVAVRLRIEGRVQGVWFRAWTVEQARDQGIDGWVRNLSGGAVEALLAGPKDRVDRMIVLCRRGPPLARVSDVTVVPEDAEVPPGFRQVS